MRFTLLAVLAIAPLLAKDLKDPEPADRLQEATTVFSEIMAAPDRGIPTDLLEKAHCIVIVPSLKMSAFFFGAKYSKGYVSCRNRGVKGWSAPASVRMEGGSVGFQPGGSFTDLILLVMNEREADKLLESRFSLGAEGSVAAGPVGRQSGAPTNADILAWSRTQGLFAGVALEGGTLRQDLDDNETLYDKRYATRQIVMNGYRPPKPAVRLVNLLNRYSRGLSPVIG